MEVAANNHEGESKEGEEEGVFFWFGDDGAMDANAQAIISARKTAKYSLRIVRAVAVVSVSRGKSGQGKVANGLVHRRRSNPGGGSRRAVVVQLAGHPRPDVVPAGVGDIAEMHVGNGVRLPTLE